MKKICFHTGASVLIKDIQASIEKLDIVINLFISLKDIINVTWCADDNIDKALSGPLGCRELYEKYYELINSLEKSGTGVYIANPSDSELRVIVSECEAYYGDNGYVMGLFINAEKPVMKMDL